MKILLAFALLATILSCDKKEDSDGVPSTPDIVLLLIPPSQTDSNYQLNQNEHYVVRNNNLQLNKLVLFIGGSYSVPKDYNLVCNHAAGLGFDVISLSYPNEVATAPLGSSSNPTIFDDYRQELCFGTPVSDQVNVDVLNAINTRSIKVLQYLKLNFPNQNWSQYLTASNTLVWNKIIVAGHSQGSGHACYIAKQNPVERVVMFSGPNDYSTYFNSPANWITQNGQTPVNKQYALLHINDNVVPFTNQVKNLRGLGLLTNTQNPTLIDNLVPPFSNAQALSISIAAFSNHNATIGANSILPNVWTYMLTHY